MKKNLRFYLITLNVFILLSLFALSTYAQAPTITSVAPLKGPVGTLVTLTGTNFNTDPTKNIVFFGAAIAQVDHVVSASEIIVKAPLGATAEIISIINLDNGLSAYATNYFTLTYLNGGAISFGNSTTITGTDLIKTIVAKDLDSDGKIDLIISRSLGDIDIYRNTSSVGNISFAPKVPLSVVGGSIDYDIAVADLNGDGLNDIVISMYGLNNISVFLNKSQKGSGAQIEYALEEKFETLPGPGNIGVADFNGDGKLDLVMTHYSPSISSKISVFPNTSSPDHLSFSPFQEFVVAPVGYQLNDLKVANVSGNGLFDVIVSSESDQVIFTNTSIGGNINFSSTTVPTDGHANYSINLNDLNNDGKQDIIASSGSRILIKYNTNFAANLIYPISGAGSGNTFVMTGDVDGDGNIDVLEANNNVNNISVLKNNPADVGKLIAPVFFPVPFARFAAALADIDGDGKLDVLSGTNSNAKDLYILLNTQITPIELTTLPATNLTPTNATLNGAVKTNVGDVNVSFDISLDNFTTFLNFAATTNAQVTKAMGATTATYFLDKPKPGFYYYKVVATDAQNVTTKGEIVKVDIPATINSITAISPNPNNGSTGLVTYDVVFSDVITGLKATNFDLTLGGTVTGATILSVNKNTDATKPTSWLVKVAIGSGGDGTIKLNLNDAIGLNAPLTNNLPFIGDTYTIDKTPPAAPTNFKVEAGQNAVKTSWTANAETDIKEYRVYAGPNSPPTGLGTVSASATFNIFTGLSNDQQYFFRMTAVDKAGNESDYTPILATTPQVGLTFKADQNIILEQIDSKKFGDPTFSPSVTNSSGIPVVFTTDNQSAVSIFGHQINIIGTGTVTIYASAVGDDKNNPAQVSRTFTIDKQNASVTGIKAISDNPNGNLSGSVTYRVDFSDPVAGLNASNFTLSGGLQNNATIQPNLVPVPFSPKSWFVNIDVDKKVSGTLQLNFDNSIGLPNSNIISIVAGDSYTIDQTPPAIPTGLKAEAGDGEVRISWDANIENDLVNYTLYFIDLSDGSGGVFSNIAKGTETYLHTGLINDHIYNYFMYASDALGNKSDFSMNVSATPKAGLKKPQTIAFPFIADKTVGDADFDLGATTESSSPIVYGTTDATIATIVNNKLHIVQAGSVIVTANAAADNLYAVAKQQNQTLTIKPAPVTALAFTTDDANPNNNQFGIVRYQLNFSSKMTGLTESNLKLSQTGNLTGVKIVKISQNPSLEKLFIIEVAIDQVSGQEGTITLQLDNTNGMSNDVTNTLPFVSETYTIDEVGPAAPTGLKAEAGNGEVRLTWNANTESDLSEYFIYVTIGGVETFLASTIKGVETYLHTGLTNGVTYSYRIYATDILVNGSSTTSKVSATPMAGNTLKTAQNITFDAILPKTYGDGDFLLPNTTTDQLLPITYTSDDENIATVTGNLVHIVKKGSVVIRANAVGNQSIADATEQTRTLQINPAAITVTANPQVKLTTDNDPKFTFTYSGNLVTLGDFGGSLTRTNSSNAPGIYPITLGTLNLSDNFIITYIGADLTINDKKDQSIDFKPLTKLTYGDVVNDFDPKANASSGLTISYSSSNPEVATIVNGLVHVKNAGATFIYAEQGGNDTYKPATLVSQILTVARMDVSIQPDAKAKALGEQDPAFTYQIVKGKLVGNDKFVGALDRAVGEKLGSYPITIGSLLLSDNYFLQLLPANLVIELKSFDSFVKDATNILTPNADGVNDYLVFKDLQKYPPIAIVITDRVGRVLYKNDHYQNNWDGTYDGKILATDTYYYYLDFGKGYSKVKGYVTLVNGK
jgi:gliding motility-associated-like protein